VFRQQIFDQLLADNRMPIPEMQRGINLGNALDAPRNKNWGLAVENEHFDTIAKAGFDFVRIPVRFQDYLDEEGVLEEPFMQTVDNHIDYALGAGLTVVLDFHHFDEIMLNPDEHSGQLLSIWTQLAERYADRPNKLVFELLNEPSKLLHIGRWNPLAAETLSVIRRTNPDRTIIIGATNMYSIFDLKLLDLPRDDRLVVAFNYYLPNQFTFQGDPWHPGYEEASGNEWGDDEDYELLAARFAAAAKLASERGWKLALNEFGVTQSVSDDLRAKWIEAVRREAEANGISWAYWEFATSFGIYNLETSGWNQKVLSALMER
jgi:endoglucanase